MKKIILSCFALVCGATLLTSCAPSKEKVKETFVTSCVNSVPGSIPKDAAKQYCECSADKLLEKYSVTEVMKMEEKIKSGDEKVKTEMMTAIQPCIDELTQKVSAQQPAAQ